MASSLAFWIEKSKRETAETSHDQSDAQDKEMSSVELHFNYWLLEAEKRSVCENLCSYLSLSRKKSNEGNLEYLDIGVKFKNSGLLESLNVYLPFQIDNEDYISTLGDTICKDIELISTVFNRSVGKVEPNEELGCYDIDLIQQGTPNPTLRFYTHLALAPSNDGVEIKKSDELNGGTQIVFPGTLFEGLEDNMEGYFRFRIVLTAKNRGVISKVDKPKDSWLTNYFDKSELVDFRLNEARILPTAIRRKVSKYHQIRKIHYFLIRDASSEYKAAHSEYKCRLLEEELWSKYLGYNGMCIRNNMLIYHWSDKAKDQSSLDNFSAFARFIRRKVTIIQIVTGLLFIFVIGVASGLFVNYIWQCFDEGVQSSSEHLTSEADNHMGSNETSGFLMSEIETPFKLDKNSCCEFHLVESESYED